MAASCIRFVMRAKVMREPSGLKWGSPSINAPLVSATSFPPSASIITRCQLVIVVWRLNTILLVATDGSGSGGGVPGEKLGSKSFWLFEVSCCLPLPSALMIQISMPFTTPVLDMYAIFVPSPL
ncbi:MAG: hypothetical protein BWY59_01394 [Verrucomicrobia bacterium ADurb.Bin345]|nr:MAG: hypothetical protein BWY59_01394 [Verrucomicrobia bacterium ADurb.Bin345]